MFEPLESRRLLSMTIVLPPIDGTPTEPVAEDPREFSGTAGNDLIAVTHHLDSILVVINGVIRFASEEKLILHANNGNDKVHVDLSPDFNLPITIYGGGGDDVIIGASGPERIFAGDGNDLVLANDGRDTVYADAGDDSVRGGGGSDLLDGGAGDDTLRGDSGNDRLVGAANSDRLRGSDGNDILDGGGSRDFLAGELGDDELHGGSGDDVLAGDAGDDFLFGDGGNDLVAGEAGTDHISGGGGADTLSGGAAYDRFYTDFTDGSDLDGPGELIDVSPTPTAVAASNVEGTAETTITWQFPAYGDDESFDIDLERSTDGGVTWVPIPVGISADSLSAVVLSADGGNHRFRLRSRGDSQPSPFSAPSNPITVVPQGAINLTSDYLQAPGDTLEISWVDNSFAEDRFEVYQRTGASGTFAKVATVPAADSFGTVVSHQLAGITAGTQYSFFVRTWHDDAGVKVDSDIYTITKPAPALDLGPGYDEAYGTEPYTLTISATGIDPASLRYVIDWGDNSTDTIVEPGGDRNPTHTYAEPNAVRGKTVTVTATAPGVSISKTKLVLVYPSDDLSGPSTPILG